MLLTNLAPGTSEDEIRAFLGKYGLPPCDTIEQMPGDGSRPAVILTYNGAAPEALRKYAERIHHMFWKNRELTAQIMTERFA